MRKYILIIAALLATVFIVSCNNAKTNTDIPEGYTKETLSGGTAFSDVNIKSVTVNAENDFLDITVDFTKGSELTVSGESDLSELPEYSLRMGQAPHSVILNVKNTEHADFLRHLPERDGFFSGALYDDVKSELYLFFSKDVAYKAAGDGSILNISFAPCNKQHEHDDYAYFVTANLYEYYKNGSFKGDDNLFPMLSRDGSFTFISADLTEREAIELFIGLKEKYPQFAPSFAIIAKYYDELPIYNPGLDYSYSYTRQIERDNDNTSVLIPDGFYISSVSEGILYEKFISNGENIHSELYIKNEEKNYRFTAFEFEGIEKCEISPDEKRIAVLENSRSGSHLYIFDMSNGSLLYDLSDAGFGKRISGFAWNDLGTCLYAVGGSDSISLHMYDFSVKDETKRHSIVYDGNMDEGSFALHDGKIYFTASDENNSKILCLSPETGIVKELCEGSLFSFYGEYCAVSTANSVSDNGDNSFYILNIENSDEKITLTDEFPVYEFIWSEDGKSIYYVKNNFSGDDTETSAETAHDDFPYTVYKFDFANKKSEKISDICAYNRLIVTEKGLFVMCSETNESSMIYAATYSIDS